MKFNKKLAKTLVFALGLGAVSFFGAQSAKASATTAPADNTLTFSPAEAKITTTDTSKFWGIAKEVKDEKKADITVTGNDGTKYYKVADVDPVLENTIDLSNFSTKKDLFIAIGATSTPATATWIVKTVKAGNNHFVVEHLLTKKSSGKKVKTTDETDTDNKGFGDDVGGLLVCTKVKDGTIAEMTTEAPNMDVKDGEGAWRDYKTYFSTADDNGTKAKLAILVENGRKLKFRLKPALVGGKAPFEWYSNESSVTISERAKAPNVKVDVFKDLVNGKKGVEYAIKVAGATGLNNWKDFDTTKKTFKELDLYKTDGLAAKGGTIEVRTKATEKKAASKIGVIAVAKQDPPAAAKVTVNEQGKDIVASKLTLNLKAKENIKNGAILENISDDVDYEYYVAWDGKKVDNPKWKKLAKAVTKKGKKTTKKAVLKFSAEEKKDAFQATGSKLFVRVAGKKQENNAVTLPSPETEVEITLTQIAQALSASKAESGDAKLTVTSVEASALAIKAKEKSSHKIKLNLTNIQHLKKKPKIKVTKKLSGVSVKVDKFVAGASGSGDAIITVSVSKGAFKEATAAQTFEFEISAEGAETKKHVMTITAS